MPLLDIQFSVLDQAAAQEMATALEGHFDSLSIFESKNEWVFSASQTVTDASNTQNTRDIVLSASASMSHAVTDLHIETAVQKDWLAENRKSFPPLKAGRFFVHGSYFDGQIPEKTMPIHIDAATAFGSGSHETTSGCLEALDKLYTQGFAPRSALDMGCGTGILAIGTAKLWREIPIIATDNDPEAARVAHDNMVKNNVAEKVNVLCGDGYKNISETSDLITANILAQPLCQMAPNLNDHLNFGGFAILAGILNEQADDVLKAHTNQKLTLHHKFVKNDWTILILNKPAR